MIVIKSFKVRLYPTKDQEDLMWKHVDAARYIWNHMIGLQQANHELGNPFIQQFDMIRMLTFIKKEDEHKWLCEVSNTCLQIVCTDLYKTYTKFFNHLINYPRFKSSKHSRKKFPVDAYRTFFCR